MVKTGYSQPRGFVFNSDTIHWIESKEAIYYIGKEKEKERKISK
jgi:hypothetical protein